MKNAMRIDMSAGQIVIMSKVFANNAFSFGTQEYAQLQAARRDYPDFTVTVRQIKRNAAQERYKGLTYDYMRWYINEYDSGKAAALKELDKQIDISKCHSQRFRYPVIKQWFLDRYPEIVKFGMPTKGEAAEKIAEFPAEKATA